MSAPDPMPDEESTGRTLVTALAAMLGVALLVGLAVGGAVLGFVRLSGMGSAGAEAGSGSRTLVVPEPSDTAATAAPSTSPSSSPSRPVVRRPAIRLVASPRSVGAGERITLSGTVPAGGGGELQVQRRDGGSWVDFPVTASVASGRFETWVQTSRTGPSQFRVVDPASGTASNPVEVAVG